MVKPILSNLLIMVMAAIFSGCSPRPAQTPLPAQQMAGYNDAVELQQRFREMADQMLASVPNDALKGYVAMPTAFVNENNTSQTSPLGRLIAESMFYEFNQRGFPAREYRLSGNISGAGGKNDIALLGSAKPNNRQKWAALLVGTYQVAKDATFVNARLVRASDGLVLRTAEMVIPNTPVVLSLLSGSASSTSSVGRSSGAYVAPQSAPVRSPTYPALGGAVIQSGTGYIPIIQGR